MPQQIPGAPGIPRIVQPAVLIIDVQPHFVDAAGEAAAWLLPRLVGLLEMADCLRLPLVATFERPQKNGWLPEELERAWPAHGQRFEKQTYDCCGEPQIAAALAALGRRQFLVAGAETDVCVLQSVLSLLERGYEVVVIDGRNNCLYTGCGRRNGFSRWHRASQRSAAGFAEGGSAHVPASMDGRAGGPYSNNVGKTIAGMGALRLSCMVGGLHPL